MRRTPLVQPLGDTLASVATWRRDAELYLPVDRDWTIDCPCMLVEDDRYTGVDPRIHHAGTEFAYALQREQVQAVIEECAKRLARQPTAEEAWRAFLHYHRYETFIGAGEAN